MRQKGNLLFLGTGSSMGIPVVGCHCESCVLASRLKRYEKLRPSALLSVNGKSLLIDCGPDFRRQALKYHIDHLDGILLTHGHFDHTGGIDELRVFGYIKERGPLSFLMSEETEKEIKKRYFYLFERKVKKQLITRLSIKNFNNREGYVLFKGIKIGYVTYVQAGMEVNGFRFGDLAYISDIRRYPSSIFSFLKGTKILVISALRYEKSFLHFSVEEACEFASKVGAETVWLTHLSHEIDFQKKRVLLPKGVNYAYDGLRISFIMRE